VGLGLTTVQPMGEGVLVAVAAGWMAWMGGSEGVAAI